MSKSNIKFKQIIARELLEIIELWPDIPVSQHFVTILRPYKDSYEWSDELLAKKIAKYRTEMETDQEEVVDEEEF